MRRFLVASLILAGLLAGAGPARAGIYNLSSPEQIWPLPLDYALIKPYLASLRNCDDRMDEAVRQAGGATDFRRKENLAQLAKLKELEKINALTTLDRVDLSSCLIRLGRNSQTIKVLDPVANNPDDPARFLVLAHLAIAWFNQNELGRAIGYQKDALAAWPTCCPWWSPERTIFYRRTEGTFLTLMQKRAKETGKWTTVDDLFPGVKFDDKDTEYEAGALDIRYADRIPTDAAYTVLQLLIWQPADDRLLWLFGEIANARQEILVAVDIFKDLIDLRRHSDVRTLARHRQILIEGAKKLTPILNARFGENRYIYQQLFWVCQPRGGLIGPVAGIAATEGTSLQGPVTVQKILDNLKENPNFPALPSVDPPSPPFVLEWRQILVAFVFGLFTAILVRAQVQEWRRRGVGLASPAEPAPRETPEQSEEPVGSGSSGKSELAP